MKKLMGVKLVFMVFLLFFSFGSLSFASVGKVNSGDTAWMLTSTAFVMFMTPAGLALFYGGMVRSKNILNTIAMSFLSYCIVSVVWVLWGYTLSFGPDIGGIIGDFKYFLMNGITPSSVEGTIPAFLFAAFQMTFAAITVALISGSVVERLKFSFWLVFSVLWVSFVYSPIAHWVWGGGFLSKLGVLDFAGGTVVHINAGVGGLVLALFVGKRKGFRRTAMPPSSITLTALGAAMLWFGWFGFNAGSALAADGSAASAFFVTNIAAAIGAISWMGVEWIVHKHPTVLGAASGAVAGLVAITPAAGFVNSLGALIIGAVSGVLGFLGASYLKFVFDYDDSLDAFGVHGLNGIWGALATGLFADPSINGAKGLFYGNFHQFLVQVESIIVVIVYTAIMTYLIAKAISVVMGNIRVDEEDEVKGLDVAIHTEKGFEL
ncbi:ammonium transporter [Hippea alviniae]|uniref:ammonium transporter n=1 Tax=Hippea alviniae TaxID=1279027 RepID=UPI0003B59EE4|nr:ammonium transporter [Hippea alviniae]